ncbi:hypothetical protein [Pseudomonas benzenivorans]|uniref:Glutathione S-transferase n=1 Tax=Pseudomonas benzenivorans TaxID=556533 RepID=A0ABY5H629_9PSED|nr:hypothetical protein [Pseudomonas benzenivorans]UTW07770.1 hypothetical protein KDW96_00060 [Pseudomonas benzenivorans]
MIDLYTAATPNGHKLSIASGEQLLPHSAHAPSFDQQGQSKPAFFERIFSGRVPAMTSLQSMMSQ